MSELRIEGRLLLDGELVDGTVVLEGGRIRAVERGAIADEDAPIIAPGLIDLHVHGFGGCDPLRGLVDGVAPFAGEAGGQERGGAGDGGLGGMAEALARAGTTAFQPTLFPAEPSLLGRYAEACTTRALQLDPTAGHARVLGLHLEGPFVSRLAAGALPLEDLAEPSPAALAALLGPATGDARGIATLTLAPELAGSRDLVAELERAGVRASFGHSRASASQARAALRSGSPGGSGAPFGVTHLYNAMTGVHHRDPGLAALALTDEAFVVELIGDLVHVGPEAIDLALRARGPAGVALVSDALEGAGTGCDVFHSHGRVHRCHAGAAWYPADDDPLAAGAAGARGREGANPPVRPERLAGSATGQLEAVRRLVAAGVVSAADALTMASLAPARAMGLEADLGVLAPGARADLIELDPDELTLRRVHLAGRPL